MIIIVDVDGVVLDLMAEVLKRYNADYDDHLTNADIKAWDVANFVKCGEKIYDYFELPEVYQQALPLPNVYHGLLELRNDHRVVFATTPAPGTAGIKLEVLKLYGFLKNENDYIEVRDKSLIRADALIDDGIHNLVYFTGERIIFDQPWNRHQSILGAWRARDWNHVIAIVRAIESIR